MFRWMLMWCFLKSKCKNQHQAETSLMLNYVGEVNSHQVQRLPLCKMTFLLQIFTLRDI